MLTAISCGILITVHEIIYSFGSLAAAKYRAYMLLRDGVLDASFLISTIPEIFGSFFYGPRELCFFAHMRGEAHKIQQVGDKFPHRNLMTVGFLCVTFAIASETSSPAAALRTSLGSMTSRPPWFAATVSAARTLRARICATHRLRTPAAVTVTAAVTVAAAAAVAAAKGQTEDPRFTRGSFLLQWERKTGIIKLTMD